MKENQEIPKTQQVVIPAEVLQACKMCVAVKQSLAVSLIFGKKVRECLKYVKVQNGYVVGTDGHRMIKVDLNIDKNIDILIPPKMIKALRKKSGDVVITKTNENGKDMVTMKTKHTTIIFESPKGIKYPDVSTAIPSEDNITDEMIWLNWGYMNDFKKIAKLLGCTYDCPMVKPTGKNKVAFVQFYGAKYDVMGYIMPMRSE